MKRTELSELWWCSTRNVRQRHLDTLTRHGVAGWDLVNSGLFGVVNGQFGDVYFDVTEPGEKGDLLFIQAIREHGVLIDLVAWSPNKPAECRLLTGHGVGLGHSEILSAEIEGRALIVHPYPLAWMRAGGEGCCPLVWHQALLKGWGWGHITKFLTSNLAFGKRVDALLTMPKYHNVRILSHRMAE